MMLGLFYAISKLYVILSNFILSYFCQGNMYGLAAFESLKIDNSEERNIRMKSVGLLAQSYKFLKKFVPYLKNQVK